MLDRCRVEAIRSQSTPHTVAIRLPGATAARFRRGDAALGPVLLVEYTLTVRNTQDLFAHMLLDMGMEGPPPPPAPPSETEAADALPNPADVRAFVLVLALGDDRFHILGQNASLDFSRNGRIVEWDHVETGSHHTGRWQPTRIVNGDERLRILPLDRVGAARVRVLSLVE